MSESKVERIRDRVLPKLKQESQSNSILGDGGSAPLSNAIEELSNSIILLKNKAKSESEIARELSGLKSNFIDVDTIDPKTFTSSITELHQDLLEMQSQTATFIDANIESNKYLSKLDKRDYESSITEANSAEELNKIKSEIVNQSADSQFLIKTLSAVRNGIEDAADLDAKTSKAFYKEIDAIGINFHKNGDVNNAAIQDLVSKVSGLRTEDGSKAVRIDSESQVLKAVEARVLKNVIVGAKQAGDQELTKVSLSINQMNNHLGSVISELDDAQRLKLESLTESYGQGQISLEEHTQSVKRVIEKDGQADEATLVKLSRLETHLNVIGKNTDKKNGTLSNAEQILKKDEAELTRENNDHLRSLLDGINTKDNVAVSSSVLKGVSSAEDLGEKGTETAIDFLMEKAGLGGKKGKRGRKGGRGLGSLLSRTR